MPTSTAMVRSNRTVSRKVLIRVALRSGVYWRSALNSRHSPMFMATHIRIAASAGRGTCFASGLATSNTTRTVMACTMPATGVCAPFLMLALVRAMALVAARPPNRGDTTLAMPCAISS